MKRPGSLIIRWASKGSSVRGAERLDRLGAERQVRDEVAVHDVEVDPVGAGRHDPPDRVGRGCPGRRRGCSRRSGAAGLSAAGGHVPHPAGDRLVAPLAAQGARRTRDHEPLATARHGGRRRLARPLRGELTACGADLLAAVAADRGRDAGRAEGRARTRSITGIGLACQGVWATGFIGMRLTWAWSPRSRSAIAVGVGGGVVHAADHRDLVADPPARRARRGRGRPRRPRRPASAGSAGRARRAAASRAAWSETASVNCGPSAVSRRMPGTTPEVDTVMCRAPRPNRRGIVERLDRREDPVEVEQRLAHAHEHDVREALAVARPGAARRCRTWSTISAVSRSRAKPSSPVAQNGQPTAQPAWLEMHSVCRSRDPARAG